MTTAVITLNAGSGGEKPIIDTLTSVDGLPAPAGSSVQIVKQAFGPPNSATTVTTATPMPVTMPAGRNKVTIDDTQADIHGQLVGVTRITQIATKFFQQPPSAFLNITVTGGATATGPTLGAAVFESGTATTATLIAQTPVAILYSAQYEAWAVLSGAYTAPTSAATFQRLGIYEAGNGYSFGYSGLTFGLWVRSNNADTFTARADWNRDTLGGAATSQFTSNSLPVALVPTNMNMFRKRYGWYGGVTAFFEVYAPDGNWVTVHQVRTSNSQPGVNLTNPDLPMTLEIGKNAADATNLRIVCGGWAAGITAPSTGVNLTGQRSLSAVNAAVTIPVSGIGELAFSILGTWAGTLNFQYSLDGMTWPAHAAQNISSKTLASSTTVNNAFKAAVGSYRFYRVIATALASGSASIVYSGSSSSSMVVAQTLIMDGNNNGPASVKPASTAAVAADLSVVVALHPSSPTPAGTNSIGTTPGPALTKGTQGAVGHTTQHLKDAGRTRVSIVFNGVAPAVADTLLTLVKVSNGVVAAGAASIAVATGKTLRITAITFSLKANAAAAAFATLSLRQNPAGATAIGSVIELRIDLGNTAAVIGAADKVTIPFPDGIEFSGAQTLGMSLAAQAITNIVSATLNGFEY